MSKRPRIFIDLVSDSSEGEPDEGPIVIDLTLCDEYDAEFRSLVKCDDRCVDGDSLSQPFCCPSDVKPLLFDPEPRSLASFGFSAKTWKTILRFILAWNDLLSMRLVSRDSCRWTSEFMEFLKPPDRFSRKYSWTFHYASMGFSKLIVSRFSEEYHSLVLQLKELQRHDEHFARLMKGSFCPKATTRLMANKRYHDAEFQHVRNELAWMVAHGVHYGYRF